MPQCRIGVWCVHPHLRVLPPLRRPRHISLTKARC
jgi:hypothetical protein